MSRKQNYKPGEVLGNLWNAIGGNEYARDVKDFVSGWIEVLYFRPKPGVYNLHAMREYKQTRRSVNAKFVEQSKITCNIVQDAIMRKDGTILRELAVYVENRDEIGSNYPPSPKQRRQPARIRHRSPSPSSAGRRWKKS